MSTFTLTAVGDDNQQAGVAVTVPDTGLPSWLNRVSPPVVTQTITGQHVTTVQSGRKYVNCSFSSLELMNHQDVWIINHTGVPYFNLKGNVKRFRMEGGVLGHRRDSGQPQIKSNPVTGADPVPEDVYFGGVTFEDSQRTTSGIHIEGIQLGGVRRIEFRDCIGRRNSIFNIFARSWIGVAGIDTAPIEDVLIQGGRYEAVTNTVDSGSGSNAIRLSDSKDGGGFLGQLRRVAIVGAACGDSIVVATNTTETFFAGNTDLAGSARPVLRAD